MRANGTDETSEGPCAQYSHSHKAIRLKELCIRSLPHEYAHAIQRSIGPGYSPAWILEGVAERWRVQYYAAMGEGTLEGHVQGSTIPIARKALKSLEDMEEHPVDYSLVLLAAVWLVEGAEDEDTLFDYFDRRFPQEEWQDTFLNVFGITVDDFYESFAAYREKVAPPLPPMQESVLEGIVVGPYEEPVAGLYMLFVGGTATQPEYEGARSSQDGTFRVSLRHGTHQLRIHTDAFSTCSMSIPQGAGGSEGIDIKVDGDISGMRIVLGGTASENSRYIQCRWAE